MDGGGLWISARGVAIGHGRRDLGLGRPANWWRELASKNRWAGKGIWPVFVWFVRFSIVLAVVSGIALLIVDSPFQLICPSMVGAPSPRRRRLLVGIAFLGWLAIDRPGTIDLIKQGFIALAFILWGVDILIPAGPWATFVGAIVIAIYVFDLAWLNGGQPGKMLGVHRANGMTGCTSEECKSAGFCRCEGTSAAASRPERKCASFRVPATLVQIVTWKPKGVPRQVGPLCRTTPGEMPAPSLTNRPRTASNGLGTYNYRHIAG